MYDIKELAKRANVSVSGMRHILKRHNIQAIEQEGQVKQLFAVSVIDKLINLNYIKDKESMLQHKDIAKVYNVSTVAVWKRTKSMQIVADYTEKRGSQTVYYYHRKVLELFDKIWKRSDSK